VQSRGSRAFFRTRGKMLRIRANKTSGWKIF
jgi:hypothetical protein